MKVMVIESGASSSTGGAERSMRSFCEHLAESHELYLAYSQIGDYVTDPRLSRIYQSTQAFRFDHPMLSTSIGWLKDLFGLVRLVRLHKIERIVTHVIHVTPLLRLVQKLTGCPYSVYYKWVCTNSSVGAKVSWGNRRISQAASVSRYVAGYWESNGVDAGSIQVVPEGVIHQACRTHTYDCENFCVGFAGRIVPEKGLDNLLVALKTLRDRDQPVNLRIAGTFHGQESDSPVPYHVNVEDLIRDLGISDLVQFDGYVCLEDWFQKIDLVVVPSTCHDAQPLVMMQAIATGTPTIGTKMGGIPEVLSGRFSDLLFASEDPNAAADLICDIKGDCESLPKLGRDLHEHAHANYSIERHFTDLKHALGIAQRNHHDREAL